MRFERGNPPPIALPDQPASVEFESLALEREENDRPREVDAVGTDDILVRRRLQAARTKQARELYLEPRLERTVFDDGKQTADVGRARPTTAAQRVGSSSKRGGRGQPHPARALERRFERFVAE